VASRFGDKNAINNHAPGADTKAPQTTHHMTTSHPTATRAAGLAKLEAFAPHAGRAYAAKRNFDYGPGRHTHVSMLSPYVRHRLISEHEVAAATLAVHSATVAEKFIQEVCWRTYWKGWLEQRPGVWDAYGANLSQQREALRDDAALAADVAVAMRGETGLACFDAWVSELVETGYLHNHARMWFASIWVFTLRLPWALGADFFLRHLLDGDAASNTLSWRWVAGLHTRGKTYLARRDNIATYTDGRFHPGPEDLAAFAVALDEDDDVPRAPLRPVLAPPPESNALLLITDEDLNPESWSIPQRSICGVAIFAPEEPVLAVSPVVSAFKTAAMADATARAHAHFGHTPTAVTSSQDLLQLAAQSKASGILTATVPVGPTQDALASWREALAAANAPLFETTRRWDELFWPHATAGFFKLKDRIPRVLAQLDL
jgi:deoxyribodipyrimidine photo-lyase